MKKYVLVVFFLFVVFVACAPKNSNDIAYAEDVSEAVDETLEEIDLQPFEDWLLSLKGEEISGFSSVKDWILAILRGENAYDFSYYLTMLTSVLWGEAKSFLPKFLLIIVVGVLYGLLKNATLSLKRVDVNKVVYLVCYGVVLTLIVYLVTQSVREANRVFSVLEKAADGCFPVLVTLLAAVGGTASATAFQPMVLAFGAVLIKLLQTVVMPIFLVSLVLGLVGNLSDHFPLGKLSSGLKSVSTWAMGLVFGLFSTILAAEGVVGASVDGLAARGAKFALSSYVPVVGSYLKDGFDVIVAGCLAVKNALGLCAVLFLLLTVLSPFIKILLLSVGMKISAGILEPISDSKFCATLTKTADSLKILLMAIACAFFAALVFLMALLFVCNPSVV